MRPNEAFSGKGHRRHICKRCARLPQAKRERRQETEQTGVNGCMGESDGPRHYRDDGSEFNPGVQPAPDLCASCVGHETPDTEQDVVCNLTRADQLGTGVFVCFAYQPISANIDREEVLRELCKQAGMEYEEEPADHVDDIPF